jgi:multidrug resistance efflux pump
MKIRTVVLLLVVAAGLLAAGSAFWLINRNSTALVISGTIEADDIHVGSKVGGRVLKVVAKEGQTVQGGETLVLLEPKEFDAALAEAQAALRQAEAKYALVSAGSRPEEIEQAEAAARQAQAELDQLASGPRQQEIDQAMAEWKAAKAQAENAQRFLQRMEGLAKRELVAKQEFDDALAKADETQQKMSAARERYDLLLAGTRKEEVERARQRWAEADAKRRQIRSGFRKEEVDQAKSEVEAARARVQLTRTQLEETVIKAPVDALVETLDLEPGDLVSAGKPVATLLRTGSLWVRAYLPEARLGFVQPGLEVKVRVDSFPRREFRGVVRRINRQGEFTPRNIQTHEERVLQVFQTEVVLDDPEHVLRPGMSADVTIQIR